LSHGGESGVDFAPGGGKAGAAVHQGIAGRKKPQVI
jgi:hypothetical protein